MNNTFNMKYPKFVHKVWEYIYDDLFQGDEYSLAVNGTFISSNTVFFSICAILSIIDCTGRPKIFTQYTIQQRREYPVKLRAVLKAWLLVLFNQTIIAYTFLPLMYYAFKLRGNSYSKTLPSIGETILHVIGFSVVEEIFFYYIHRLFHHPKLYKHIHKKHHDWQAPIAISSLYAHPIEHLFANLLPAVLGPIVFGSHVLLGMAWFVTALVSSILSHMGYHLPFLPSTEHHDYHHLKFTDNFGVFGVLDWLHGTDKNFRKSVQFKRHKVLLGFEPLIKKIPSLKKQ